MVKHNLLESLNLFTLCVSLNGDKARQSGWLSCPCSAPSGAPRSRVGVVFFMNGALWSLGAPHTAVCSGPALSHATLCSQVRQDDFANVCTPKEPSAACVSAAQGQTRRSLLLRGLNAHDGQPPHLSPVFPRARLCSPQCRPRLVLLSCIFPQGTLVAVCATLGEL